MLQATPSTVGPGAYSSTSGVGKTRPSFAGFSTSASRKLTAVQDGGTMPGPGAYIPDAMAEIPKNVDKRFSSNNFKSKVARLAPSYPGSTAYTASSVSLSACLPAC